MFIGRTQELKFLNNAYNSNKAEFITVYGRRRVGKTETLAEFCKGKNHIFYSCNEYTNQKQFDSFCKKVADYDRSLDGKMFFRDWEAVFSHLGDIPTEQKLVIVIDEFPYMVKGDKSIPSVLQNLWDHSLCHANIMLILCGSSVSFMEDEILGSKNPLYGRMTGIYKIEPLPFYDAIKFFPNYSYEDKFLAYAILGGIPHYLKQFDPNITLDENIKRNILAKGTVLNGEVDYILHQELREPAAYNTILEAIALGNSKFNEIRERSLIETNKLSVYLKNLLELGLIKREFPVLTAPSEYAKKNHGEYKIEDYFFRFWYSYAYGSSDVIAMGKTDFLYNNFIKKDLHNFASKPFETLCIQYVTLLNAESKLPTVYRYLGRWWGKITATDENGKLTTSSEEIDILCADATRKNFIVGECKFRNEPIDNRTFERLKSKVPYKGNIHYVLFSLSGFSQTLIDYSMSNHDLSLYTLSDIIDDNINR